MKRKLIMITTCCLMSLCACGANQEAQRQDKSSGMEQEVQDQNISSGEEQGSQGQNMSSGEEQETQEQNETSRTGQKEGASDKNTTNGVSENENTKDEGTGNNNAEALNNLQKEDLTAEKLKQLYENRSTPNAPSDFTGDWERTNVHSSLDGIVRIKEQNAEGFEFEGEFYYFSHSGIVDGTAYFVSDRLAIYQQEAPEWSEDKEAVYVGFWMEDDNLWIIPSGAVQGMGANVFVDGEYTQEQPVYLNADILSETYSEAEVESIRIMLGEEDYTAYFQDDTELGVITVEEHSMSDGTLCRYIDCFVPTMGGYMGYSMIIAEDGRIYFQHVNGTFATNDGQYTETGLPQTN